MIKKTTVKELSSLMDLLIIENFELKTKVKALEELMLALASLHPECSTSIRTGYASRLLGDIPMLGLLTDLMHSEESLLMLQRKIEALKRQAQSFCEYSDRPDADNCNDHTLN